MVVYYEETEERSTIKYFITDRATGSLTDTVPASTNHLINCCCHSREYTRLPIVCRHRAYLSRDDLLRRARLFLHFTLHLQRESTLKGTPKGTLFLTKKETTRGFLFASMDKNTYSGKSYSKRKHFSPRRRKLFPFRVRFYFILFIYLFFVQGSEQKATTVVLLCQKCRAILGLKAHNAPRFVVHKSNIHVPESVLHLSSVSVK